jgi:hypothetical protein
MLVLVKLGYMTSLTEKRISAEINTYLRCPGLVLIGVVMLGCGMHNAARTPVYVVLVCAALAAFNGIYYGQMAQDNYAEKRTQAAINTPPSSQHKPKTH